MKKQFCLSILLIAICCELRAQYVDYGEDPARLKWRQIKTEHYRLIYPAGNERRANLYANILESIYPHVRNTLAAKRSSVVPVVLHPYNVNANGMVSWAPKRMELLPSPDFDSRLQRPELNLLVHESRHIVQIDKQNSGIFRPFYFLFGEQTMGIASLLKPQWLLEGEAVVTETALSSSGRGRVASFLMPYRAQIATGKNFSLDKWFLGSYRDNTHNFYALGYAMTSYARLNYGAGVWDKVWNDMNCSLLHPVALKKNTGLTPIKLFKSTFEALGKEWDSLMPENPDSLTFISKNHRQYTSYKYPQEVENGVISLKTSLSEVPAIVFIDSSGKEHFLTYAGNVNSKPTYSDGFVYWSEYIPGIRWQHENYSVVKQLNLHTLQVKNISKRSRYFIPTVTSGKIAVFEHEPNGQNSIVMIDRSGQKLKSYPVIDNMPVQDMVIDDNGKILASLTGQGNAVFRLDPNTSQWEKMLDYQRTNIESLRMYGGQLLFESGYNGVNNIYSLDTSSFSIKRLTNSMYGSFSGTFSRDGNKLYLSDYSAKGYRIASIDTKNLNKKSVTFDSPYKFKTAEALSSQELFNIDEHTFSDTVEYVSKPYKKAANLFNIHSWFPFYLNLDEAIENYRFEFNQVKPGVFLLSQNRLNTLTSQVAYYYDNIGKAHHGFLSLRYSGWFPVLSFKMDVGGQKYRISSDGSYSYAWENRRTTATFSAYIPLKFTDDYNIHGLQPFMNFKYDNGITGSSGQHYYNYLYSGIYYYRYHTLAHNDIFPKFGWQMWLNYVGNPANDMSELLIGKINLYLPGILSNHSLRISASLQRQLMSGSTRYYFFEQYVDIARGRSYSDYIRTTELYTVKGDYSFPIVYPDVKVGSLMYLSRIRGNLFYDITIKQPSYGFDLTLDMYFLRIRYSPLTLMFRTIKIPKHNFIYSFSTGVSF
ncbi:MAG: hypothetical protein LBE04_08335 [Prevotellaceae bacterium]|jgi:hypothetical protein|nr:hypothetical protein [Prevotellaceae bacterium]